MRVHARASARGLDRPAACATRPYFPPRNAALKEPRCQECRDTGWVDHGTEDGAAVSRCACALERDRLRRTVWLKAGVPTRFRGVGLARAPLTSLPPAQLSALTEFYDHLDAKLDSGRGLWLSGETGVGKSAAAALMVQKAIQSRRSALFCDVPELLTHLRSTYREDTAMDDMALYRQIREVELLVLDDLGAAKLNDWVREQLFIFINGRYKDERAVIITSDLDAGQLRAAIGARTVRRLEEICGSPLTLSLRDLEPQAAA